MFKWLRGLREGTKPIDEDANRILAKPKIDPAGSAPGPQPSDALLLLIA